MEAENISSDSCNFETNWTVADGSLSNSVTFESSDSPIDDSIVSTHKSPLLLCLPSPNSGLCEIKISFAQKHEVRQVYVRSTARVYEIYYTPNPSSSNEYLCTVRCGLAAEGNLLHSTDVEEASHLNGSIKQLAEERSKSDSNVSSSEDDWIEVKVPEFPLPESTKSSLPSKNEINLGRSKQVFYEATAQITDADPCTSLILRLLSLEDKGCVYVDEVYIFADPVDLAESEDQLGRVENSAGSSLMATLVPTLLQLSKTGSNRVQDTTSFQTRSEPKSQENGSTGFMLTNTSNKYQLNGKSSVADQQDVKLQEINGSNAKPTQSHIPTRGPDMESRPDSSAKEKDSSYCQIERAMDQLASRVNRIEEFCLRFEENMLKPICSIEAKLQRVEQQLEVLTRNSQFSKVPSGTRFFAPEFSCIESTSNSFYNDGSDNPCCEAFGSEERDNSSGKLFIPPDGSSASVNGTKLLPNLMITAPKFSNYDDEEEVDASEPVIDSTEEKPKQAMPIDDALASALAGFISSTSLHPQQYTQILAVKDSEFPNDEDGNEDIVASQGFQCQAIYPSISTDETNEIAYVEGSLFSPHSVDSSESEHEAPRSFNDEFFEQTTEGVEGGGIIYGGGESNDLKHHVLTPAKHGVEDNSDMENSFGGYKLPICDDIADPNKPTKSHTKGSSDFTNELSAMNSEIASGTDLTTNVAKEGSSSSSSIEILHNVLEFSCAAPVVDFEAPILDVRFTSWENSITKSPLEVLLANREQFSVKDHPCIEESGDGTATGIQCDLILVEEREAICTASDNDLIVEVRFTSQENSIIKSPLEVLASREQFSVLEHPYVKESDDGTVTGNQCDLILVEEGEALCTASNNDLIVDMFHFELENKVSNMDGGEIQDHTVGSSQEVSAASLI